MQKHFNVSPPNLVSSKYKNAYKAEDVLVIEKVIIEPGISAFEIV